MRKGYANANGVKLYFEDTGSGTPILFVHEFASDHRQWAGQVAFLSRRYRCIAFNARGYPPSDVPDTAEAYSQAIAADDIAHVMDALGLERAYVAGVSMGAAAALHFGMRYPERTLGLIVASAGSGAYPPTRDQFVRETLEAADLIEAKGMAAFADALAMGPTRLQLKRKNPDEWEAFRWDLSDHSAIGSAMTLRNCQARRASLFDLKDDLSRLAPPVLLVTGDEDDPVLETNLYLKRTIPRAGLLMLPQTGHAVNLEEPAAYGQAVLDFIADVERGEWQARDGATQTGRQFPVATAQD